MQEHEKMIKTQVL